MVNLEPILLGLRDMTMGVGHTDRQTDRQADRQQVESRPTRYVSVY